MNRFALSLLCVLLVLPSVRAEGPAILVCDMKRIAEGCDEAIELVEALKKRSDAKRAEMQADVNALQGKQRELLGKKLSERDLKWYEDYRAAVQQESELKAKAAIFNAQMNDDIARKIDQLMKGTRQEAAAVMKERGASMVLISKMGALKFENDEELKEEYIFRRVLCCDPALDITEEVLARMNKWWKEHKAGSGEAPKRGEGEAKGAGKGAKDDTGKPPKGS